jgi:hypothetical protein
MGNTINSFEELTEEECTEIVYQKILKNPFFSKKLNKNEEKVKKNNKKKKRLESLQKPYLLQKD